jgi:hypothetical protein
MYSIKVDGHKTALKHTIADRALSEFASERLAQLEAVEIGDLGMWHWVGAELIKRQTALGFGAIAGHGSYEAMRDKILDESKRVFKPEFLNRLDDMIVFHQLERNDLVKIVDLEVAKVIERGTRQGYQGSPGYDRSRVSDR